MNNFGLRFHFSSLTDGASSIDKAFIMQKGKRRRETDDDEARGKAGRIANQLCMLIVVCCVHYGHHARLTNIARLIFHLLFFP